MNSLNILFFSKKGAGILKWSFFLEPTSWVLWRGFTSDCESAANLDVSASIHYLENTGIVFNLAQWFVRLDIDTGATII